MIATRGNDGSVRRLTSDAAVLQSSCHAGDQRARGMVDKSINVIIPSAASKIDWGNLRKTRAPHSASRDHPPPSHKGNASAQRRSRGVTAAAERRRHCAARAPVRSPPIDALRRTENVQHRTPRTVARSDSRGPPAASCPAYGNGRSRSSNSTGISTMAVGVLYTKVSPSGPCGRSNKYFMANASSLCAVIS